MPKLHPAQFEDLVEEDTNVPEPRGWIQRAADKLVDVMATKERFR